VACIARPACPKKQWFIAGIYDAMRKAAGNVVQASREHRIGPGGAALIHKYQQAFAADGAVIFSRSRLE